MRKKEDRKSYDRIYGFLKEKGVTIIALVVTIVVLLILAGISINAVLGNNGVIKQAKNAGEKAMVIKDIPVGANVTINAIYNTLSYKLTSSETATVKLENNTKTVNFEYTYDYKNISGSSATTAVVYNGSSLSQK